MYPTKDQILGYDQKFKPGVLRLARQWKREFAGRRRTPEALRALVARLADAYGVPQPAIEFRPGVADHYSPGQGVIRLDPRKASVVTALHEFAHHAFGRSEFRACRWSVHLFKRLFPRTFARGRFVGHKFVLSRDTEGRALSDEQRAMLDQVLRTIGQVGATGVQWAEDLEEEDE